METPGGRFFAHGDALALELNREHHVQLDSFLQRSARVLHDCHYLHPRILKHSQLSAIVDNNRLRGLSALGSNLLDFLDNIHTFNNGSEDDVLAIEPWCFYRAQEKLRSVRIWTSVGHRENTWSCMLEREIFICELGSVDGFTTSSISCCEISALAHEVRNHTMKRRSLEMQRLSGFSHTLLASAAATKVLASFWNHIGAQLHDNATSGSSANGHIEKYFRVGHLFSDR